MTALRQWIWRRNIRRQLATPLNAWGFSDVGYW
jgi:hypothetical protein